MTLTRRIASPLGWTLIGLLPFLAGCGGGGESVDASGAALDGQDFDDSAVVDPDGDVTGDDPDDDVDFQCDDDTVDVDTTITCERTVVSDVDEDAAAFADDAGAVVKVAADREVPGVVTITFTVGEWTGPGFSGSLYVVLLDRPDGTVAFADGHEATIVEETGKTQVRIQLAGTDISWPGHDGALLVILPLDVDLEGQTSMDGVEDPDVEAGDEVETECDVTTDGDLDLVEVDVTCVLCPEPGDWKPVPGADPCETFDFSKVEEGVHYVINSTCEQAADQGPSLSLTVTACTLTADDMEVALVRAYVLSILTKTECADEPPRTISDLRECDQMDRIDLASFAGLDTGFKPHVVTGYLEGIAFLNLEDATVVRDLDYLEDYVLFSTFVQAAVEFQLAGIQAPVEAVISGRNSGYGITHYDPVAGQFGATEIDPSSGSVSDADNYEEDPSRAVFVQSGRNQVRFIEIVTPPFSGPRFSALDPLLKSIPSTLFPGATGFVITATRRTDTSPVYFVTVGATPTDPGQLWRKDDPTDRLTPATALGAVGALPRRIRFAGPVGAVSNSQSNTLTILTRDASDNVAIKGTVNVGDGPIGLDLLLLPDGKIGILSTGYRDHTYTVTILEPDGDVVSNETSPVPDGGLNPSSAVWANAEGTRIAVSCNGSDKVVIFSIG